MQEERIGAANTQWKGEKTHVVVNFCTKTRMSKCEPVFGSFFFSLSSLLPLCARDRNHKNCALWTAIGFRVHRSRLLWFHTFIVSDMRNKSRLPPRKRDAKIKICIYFAHTVTGKTAIVWAIVAMGHTTHNNTQCTICTIHMIYNGYSKWNETKHANKRLSAHLFIYWEF